MAVTVWLRSTLELNLRTKELTVLDKQGQARERVPLKNVHSVVRAVGDDDTRFSLLFLRHGALVKCVRPSFAGASLLQMRSLPSLQHCASMWSRLGAHFAPASPLLRPCFALASRHRLALRADSPATATQWRQQLARFALPLCELCGEVVEDSEEGAAPPAATAAVRYCSEECEVRAATRFVHSHPPAT